MHTLELLAPAGNWTAMVAAVQSGADAVYFGGKQFNARQNADNFDDAGIKSAVDYLHLRGKRAYITLNTLIKEHEMADVLRFVAQCYQIGVDALILQDIGLASCVKKYFPLLPIHASTQCGIHNTMGVQKASELGFSRVILARETSIADMKIIHEAVPNMALEAFVHGALCVSFSGQCLMSSMLGGRSGNRGTCAQPCRLPYQLWRDDERWAKGYRLSLKDLCAYSYLHGMINAGVTSFKIEGRLKRPEYVSVVMDVYRRAIDHMQCYTEDDMDELKRIYNRGGFTKGYAFGTDENELLCATQPNHMGLDVGHVIQCSDEFMEVKLFKRLGVGDKIRLVRHGAELDGQSIHSMLLMNKLIQHAQSGQTIKIKLNMRTKPQVGDLVVQVEDAMLLHTATARTRVEHHSIPLSGKISIHVGKPAELCLWVDALRSEVFSHTTVSLAQQAPITEAQVRSAIQRTGGTVFAIENLEVKMDDQAWLPLKELNEMRRHALQQLEQLILQKRRPYPPNVITIQLAEPIISKNELTKPILIAQVRNFEQAQAAIQGGADEIYYLPECFDTLPIYINEYPWLEDFKQLFLVLPPITLEKDMQVIEVYLQKNHEVFKGVVCSHIGQIAWTSRYFSQIHGDIGLNVMNSHTLQVLGKTVTRATLSPELKLSEIKFLTQEGIETEIIVQGRLPLMHLVHCPVRAISADCSDCKGFYQLEDRKGMRFPLMRVKCANCMTYVLNAVPHVLIEEIPKLLKAHVDAFRIMFFAESNEEILQTTKQYQSMMNNEFVGIDEINNLKKNGFTTGHYWRGV